MERTKKLELLVDLFEVDELTPDTVLAELENWDSMTKLSLIVMIDDEYGKKVTSENIKGFKTVRDIMDFMY